MVFSASNFLFFFLPIALAIALFAKPSAFRPSLLVLSLAFYYWSSGSYVIILIADVVIAYFGALAVDLCKSARLRNAVVGAAIVLLVGILVFFKYLDFIAVNLDLTSGSNLSATFAGIILPIGISFFTFQALSYLIDVYRREIPAERNVVLFSTYFTFFPHLIAGPIVRFRDVVDDFRAPRISLENFSTGATRFAHGLMKKVIIADGIAPIPDAIFAAPHDTIGFATAWLAAATYGIQLYFDFSGYSDMAIGLARMFGIRFAENFERPYASRSITEFWRRWHISLSSWFRDYLYIPLGGSRHGRIATYRNLLIVFAVTGLWHGASWTFFCWGMFHGLFILVERVATGTWPKVLEKGWLRYAYFLPVVTLSWPLFRATSLEQAMSLWKAMASPDAAGAFSLDAAAPIATTSLIALVAGAAIYVLPGRLSFGQLLTSETRGDKLYVAGACYTVVALMVCQVLALSGGYTPFLYFQF
ncbi:MBOAT family protein [Mesorhizobium sp. M0619]|uniref:MBOAT family O-acyltransferase n=1 Tax=unclassified Mesorhizobium TaxID=325217 RepID=UPI00333C5B36